MTAVEEPRTPKKRAAKKAAPLQVVDGKPKPKPKPPPGSKDYDWGEEYPGEEFYVYTAPSSGLTIGLAKLTPQRKPKPGKLRRLHHEGGLATMWYFIELVSSPTSLDLQEELDEVEYNDMLRGWADFAGIELKN